MSKQLKVELLDPQKLVSTNKLKEISNPIFFVRDNIPTDDGLLSNDIFGISKADRSNNYAYIDLYDWFIHPLIYKQWKSMDRKIEDCIYGTKKFSINEKGELVEDDKGGTGIGFLKKNFKNLKIKETGSNRRSVKIKLIEENPDLVFMNKMIIIPAYYRDVQSSGGRRGVGVGEINKLYNSLILAVRSLKETADYGINMSNGVRARIQETIVAIYDWFVSEPNLAKKNGIIRRSVLSKTADYASRLVISAPSIDGERYTDLMVDLDHSAVPLASVCSNLYPFIIFNIRRYLDNEFASGTYEVKEKDGSVVTHRIKDYQENFSDEIIKKQIDRYIHGYSNRFIPVQVPLEDGRSIYMKFKGTNVSTENVDKLGQNITMVDRRLTWCDLIYISAVEAARDKHVLITRYPLEDYFGQFPTKIRVSSTKKTEPMILENTTYKFYPYIREEMIEGNTSNMFVDTLQLSNLYLKGLCGDYDGDQTTVKAAYSIEANKELEDYMNSKYHYLSISGENIRTSSNEAIQALYSLTKIIDQDKLVKPEF